MAIKELQTRIALKYDSYSNWTEGSGKNLVLLAGEMGICEIPTANVDSNVAPPVLFKVGGAKYPEGHEKAGQLMAFKDLPWASARAADVYDWAKAKDVVLNGKTIEFKNSDGTVVKSVILDYITEADVSALTEGLAGLNEKVNAIEESLADIVKATDGVIDSRIAAAEGRANTYADGVGTAAKTYAKGLDDNTNLRIDNLAITVASNTENIAAEQERAVEEEAKIRDEFAAADLAILNTIGTATDTATTDTVYGAIAKAKADAADDASSKVNKLGESVTANSESLAQILERLSAEEEARQDADDTLSDRIDAIDAFFATTEGEKLDEALDTLKEIQDYLNGEGSATDGVLGRLATAENAIEDLNDIVGTDGTLTSIVNTNTENIAGLDERVSSLTELVDEVSANADQGIADAAAAAASANAAQDDVDALKLIIGDSTDGLVKLVNTVESTANAAVESISAAEERISALEEIVASSDDTTIKDDVAALQSLVNDTEKGNTALYDEISRIAELVDDADAGLAKTKEVADAASELATANAERIAAIEEDCLRESDMLIFNCGSSTTEIFEKSAT